MSESQKPLVEKVRQVIELCGMEDISDAQLRAAVVALLHYADTETGKCWPSKRQLAEKACVSPTTVGRMWSALKAKGLVKKIPSTGGRNKRCTYYVKTIPPADSFRERNRESVSPVDQVVRNGGPQRVAPADTHIILLFILPRSSQLLGLAFASHGRGFGLVHGENHE